MKAATHDEYWMLLALELAAEGEGLTRPNPPVGAIVVKNDHVIGEGYHPKAGLPHAEIYALREAGPKARGATLYVTLEPCSTTGRTPPCTEAIIAAGIKRVVFGCVDPNPSHAGNAIKLLKKAGITVTQDILKEPCEILIAPFASRILNKRPFFTLKLACSLDGRIADAAGHSKWITGEKAREAVQELRRSVDGIMIGAETLRSDNPSLFPRPAFGRNPFRIIIAGSKSLPISSKIFTDANSAHSLVFAPSGFHQRKLLEKRGVRVFEAPARRGRLSMKTVAGELAKLECLHVVCEGGGELAHALLQENLVDQLWLFYAPKILGEKARPAVSGKGWRLDQAPDFQIKHIEPLGQDLLVVARK